MTFYCCFDAKPLSAIHDWHFKCKECGMHYRRYDDHSIPKDPHGNAAWKLASREKVLDALTEQAQELGFYD